MRRRKHPSFSTISQSSIEYLYTRLQAHPRDTTSVEEGRPHSQSANLITLFLGGIILLWFLSCPVIVFIGLLISHYWLLQGLGVWFIAAPLIGIFTVMFAWRTEEWVFIPLVFALLSFLAGLLAWLLLNNSTLGQLCTHIAYLFLFLINWVKYRRRLLGVVQLLSIVGVLIAVVATGIGILCQVTSSCLLQPRRETMFLTHPFVNLILLAIFQLTLIIDRRSSRKGG